MVLKVIGALVVAAIISVGIHWVLNNVQFKKNGRKK